MITGSLNTLEQFVPHLERDRLQLQNWARFQRHIDLRLRMYYDSWEGQLMRYIRRQISEETAQQFFPNAQVVDGDFMNQDLWPKWPLPMHANVLKRVVKETSLIYNMDAQRSFSIPVSESETNPPTNNPLNLTNALPQQPIAPQKPTDSERFAGIVGGNFNAKMRKVNELTNLCNLVLVRPVIDLQSETGFRFDILTPDMFTPIQSIDDPSKLIGLLYVVDLTDSQGSFTNTRREYLIYMGMPDEEPFIMEGLNNISANTIKQEYPYYYNGEKYLPFAIFRKDEPMLGEFINRTAGRDLYQGTLQVGYLMSLFSRAYKESTGNQMVITGPSASEFTSKTLIRDALSVLMFPFDKQQAELKQIDQNQNLGMLWEGLEKYILSILAPYGITEENFKGVRSGVSIKIANEKIIQIIQGQYSAYRAGEKQLAQIIRAMNNTMLPSEDFEIISDEADYIINFGKTPFEDDPADKWPVYEKLIEQNIMSKAEVLLLFDPDLETIEEAQAQLMKNAQLNREATRAGSPAFNMPQTALGQMPQQKIQTDESLLLGQLRNGAGNIPNQGTFLSGTSNPNSVGAAG